MKNNNYDIAVIGGGHAGIEAALASARLGCKTALITIEKSAIARMSCNPSIGGLAKGHLVRELDILGGEMGKAIDAAGIQFKLLNRSKGRAVWSPRAQADKLKYEKYMQQTAENCPSLYIIEQDASSLIIKQKHVKGVIFRDGSSISAEKVILTCGTFLRGLIHIGNIRIPAGRYGELPSIGLSDQLKNEGFDVARLKTGTPVRITKRSIDFDNIQIQHGDEKPHPFSHSTKDFNPKNRPCWLTYTTSVTHDILRTALDRSPLYTGKISGVGPRYCPSIEDKIVRFSQKDQHQLFLEPEGYRVREVYVNGFSTSLPEEVQFEALRQVPGMEEAHMLRPGYAIEYDFFPPYQIQYSLETKSVDGLFFAGQINGTTGYEEAAAQGLMAGINAVQKLRGADPIVLKRSEAYIGVLIDDLVAKGTDEPYRMFTSRAEHRILLRQDNADLRLTELGRKLGLASQQRYDRMRQKEQAVDRTREAMENTSVSPEQVDDYLQSVDTSTLDQPRPVIEVCKRPEVDSEDLLRHAGIYDEVVTEAPGMLSSPRLIEIDLKYEGYIDRQQDMVEEMKEKERWPIPDDFDYESLDNVSIEAREKLSKVEPDNLGQASRVP